MSYQEHDIAILGPNCNGYVNISRHVELGVYYMDHPLIPGSVAFISQSGGNGYMLFNYGQKHSIGASLLVATGNEAVISVADVLDYAIEDEATRAIGIYVEALRNPERFVATARKALQKGKPIVALKVGRGQVSAKVAMAHTGGLVGDDRVIDALFHQLGVIRVDSAEELVFTANILAQTGQLAGNRLGFTSMSGGAVNVAADRAERVGLSLPEFTEQSQVAVRNLIPSLSVVLNPFDATGVAAGKKDLMGQVITAASKDGNFDVLLVGGFPLVKDEEGENSFAGMTIKDIAETLHHISIPAFTCDSVGVEPTAYGRSFCERFAYPFLPGGLEQVLAGLGRAAWWSERVRQARAEEEAMTEARLEPVEIDASNGAWSEYQARTLLERYGIPLVPVQLVTTAEQAIAAAQSFAGPVALKIASPDLLHKSDIGDVRLNLHSDAAVREAFQQILSAAEAVTPTPKIEGILVSPMRTGGIELLVGIVRDPMWGQVLAVGLGGIWVEILKDTSLCVLPVSRLAIHAMLDELQGSKLLQGARGTKPADKEKLVEVIYRVSALAQMLGDKLESLEMNPLRVDGSQIEALDALIT
ncbi:MAG: acetate--CoA ligase family protein [Ktedonobacteraceae bacterium]